ncbi:hypothetical protein GCM10009117_24020 [Gangjinia marincola]|uniref:BLUF domain-containing protein n=2 Tax=Gangjinia marincola TaxID=578463 RepID=A0ABN1MJ55_9FLAO
MVDSVTWNEAHDIHGAFIYTDGNFFQILEGPKELVKPLFENIKSDDRHHMIIKLYEKEIEEYTFDQYESSFTIADSKQSMYALKEHLRETSKQNQSREAVSYLLDKFMAI